MDAGRAQQRLPEATRQPAAATPIRKETPGAVNAASGDASLSQARTLGQVRDGQPSGRGGPGQPALQSQGEAAQQNRGKVLTDPKEIVNHQLTLSPQIRENFAKLTPDQQKTLVGLMQSQVAPGTKYNTTPQAAPGGLGLAMGGAVPCDPGAKPGDKELRERAEQMNANAARNGLVGLLSSGKLTSTDRQGQTLLSNLDRLQTQKLAPGADRNALLRSTVRDLGMPGFGGGQGNIAAGELQTKLATDKPADYARMVGDLASPEGKSKLGNTSFQRSSEALKSDGNPFQSVSARLISSSTSEAGARQALYDLEVAGNPQAQQRIAAMSAEDRKRFQSLYESSIPSGNAPKLPPMAKDFNNPTQAERDAQQTHMDRLKQIDRDRTDRGNLSKLLESGKLSATDSQGKSLLTNLNALKHQTFAQEGVHKLDGAQVYSEVLNQVARPGDINQGGRGTCTVTTMEHLQATREPAEYVRLLSGLTSAEGSVVLRNGEKLSRDTGLVAPDDSGRTAASRVYQASMMEFANGPDQDYRNEKDGHFRKDGAPILDDRGKLSQGLSMEKLAKVSSAAMEGDFQHKQGTLGSNGKPSFMDSLLLASPVTLPLYLMRSSKSDQITADISQALSQKQSVQVGMRWSRNVDDRDGYHALSLYKMDDKYVYLRNPWGQGEQGETNPNTGVVRQALPRDPKENPVSGGFGFSGQPAVDPSLPTGEAGTLRMKKEDFYANLAGYAVQSGGK